MAKFAPLQARVQLTLLFLVVAVRRSDVRGEMGLVMAVQDGGGLVRIFINVLSHFILKGG